MFVLARHADAADKRAWPGDDADRPLSAIGQQQAVGLANNLTVLRLIRLTAGPDLRCRQTLQPLAARLGVVISTDPRLDPTKDGHGLALDDALFNGAVICARGEIVAALLSRWSGQGLVRMPIADPAIRKNDTAKGAAWLVTDDGQGLMGHYIPTLHVGPVLNVAET